MENIGRKRSVDGYLEFYKYFRAQISKDAEKTLGKYGKIAVDILLTGPDLFIFLFTVYRDPEVPLDFKAALASVLLYWAVPIDFFSELFAGVLGYVDDIFLAAFVLNKIIEHLDEEKLVKYWPGPESVAKSIEKILYYADFISSILGKDNTKKLEIMMHRISQRLNIPTTAEKTTYNSCEKAEESNQE